MKPILPHTASEFKRNELATLEYLHNRSFFEGIYDDLNAAIASAYSRFCTKDFKNGKKNFDFDFVSDFDIVIESKEHRIVIHAAITGNYDFMSYSIGIAQKDVPEKLIRRFHFDYDHKKVRSGQKAFISHLQYGGKAGEGFVNPKLRYHSEGIVPQISVPRLSFYPVNLALLFDIVFCEFQNAETERIIENPDWRSLIKKNEEFMLRHYFIPIANHINSTRHTKDLLVRDICYA